MTDHNKAPEPGMVQIYYGDGKGKTSALCGSALRFAGHGGKVLFAQFLKDGTSGEIKPLANTEGVTVRAFFGLCKFTGQMTQDEWARATADYALYLSELRKEILSGAYGMVILDEVTDACGTGLISWLDLYALIRNRPKGTEFLISGHAMTDQLLSMADYITEVKKIRHPYDQGIAARAGIEY